MHYALAAHPLPARGIPTICVPTTAGTGSELSATNIFANAAGKKLWIWGQETKTKRVVHDPALTVSLPPAPTAWNERKSGEEGKGVSGRVDLGGRRIRKKKTTKTLNKE